MKPGDTKKVLKNSSWTKDIDPDQLQHFNRYLINASGLAGAYYAADRQPHGLAVSAPENRTPGELPVPPVELWHGYGRSGTGFDPAVYLDQGLNNAQRVKDLVGGSEFSLLRGPILDFGCSAGRMLRHFHKEAKSVECWGCDIHSEAIQWCRTHLSPPFHFLMNTSTPHLPFTDGYFNLIYAGSVFSHIGELDDAWVLELRRITRTGGRILLTFNDHDSVAAARRSNPRHHWVTSGSEFMEKVNASDPNWIFAVTGTTPWVQRVFYNREWWRNHLARWFNVVDLEREAYGWQSAIVLEVQ